MRKLRPTAPAGRSGQPNFATPCACDGRRFHRMPGMRFRSCEVVRCRACGLLRTFPEPADVTAIYDGDMPGQYAIDRTTEYFEVWQGFASRVLDTLERHVQPGRLLDVGCDQAVTLLEAQRRGWQVEGVEVNKSVARHVSARTGIVVHERPLEELALPEGSYDAVVLNQVVEHLFEPTATLAAVRQVLRPGGVVLISTPCFTAPIGLFLLRDRWYALQPQQHVWQFGPLTLRRLIRRSGLRVVESQRGCSKYWDEFSWRPRRLVHWLVFRAVAVAGQGDFLRYVARR